MANPPIASGVALLFDSPDRYWASPTITFGFPQPGATDRVSRFFYTDEPGAPGYAALTPAQQAQAIMALGAWDQLIASTLVPVADQTTIGNIRFAFTDYEEISDNWGYAGAPPLAGTGGSVYSGDIWINAEIKNSNFARGGFDYMALLHEIGHALGLDHSFSSAGFDLAFDSSLYTVMSYTDVDFVSRTFVRMGSGLQPLATPVFATTPMVLDIAAIQHRYGADPTTATGDDTYQFSQAAPFRMAIYDAGGIDTIDIAGHTRGSVLDLRPGAYSDIAAFSVDQQIAAAVAQFGEGFRPGITNFLTQSEGYTWTNNLGIAFSTTIENARTGSGADKVTGNAAANMISTGAGDDSVSAGDGDDVLIGGPGDDFINGEGGSDTVVFGHSFAQGGLIPYICAYFVGGDGLDLVLAVEVFQFTDGTIDIRDDDRLVDDLFYYANGKDVWAARADADTHYKTMGWKEGRDPNYWFDTKGYMAAYGAEVLAAGLDPLTHYLNIGWTKNYDPSVMFDTSQYLAAYADVANGGMNPLLHFFQFGQFELRSVFNDGVFDR